MSQGVLETECTHNPVSMVSRAPIKRPPHAKPKAPATAAALGPLVDLKSAPVENPAANDTTLSNET